MKINFWTALFSVISLSSFYSSAAHADLSPVFEYSFPASYDGTTTTLTDLSPAGNHGVVQSSGAFLADFRPGGFTTGGSIHGLLGGRAMTNGVNLLNNNLIAANGGFTMEAWVRWDEEDLVGGVVQNTQIISYAGTSTLMTISNQLAMVVSMADELGNETFPSIIGPVIEVGQWYHIVGGVNTEGNQVVPGGHLQGEMFFVVDGQVQGPETPPSGLIHGVGSILNRPSGLNAWPGDPSMTQGQFFGNGKVFNPSMYLGAVELPVGTPGDFDLDGDVDGQDFLMWQRGESPAGNGVSSTDLADWQANYGIGPLQANVASVPEPATAALLALAIATLSLTAPRSNR